MPTARSATRPPRHWARSAQTRRRRFTALINDLRDPDEYVRILAKEALGSILPDEAAAIPALINALRDADDWVRSSAAAVLGSIGPDAVAAVPALEGALRDQHAMVREASRNALASIRGESNDAA